MATEYAALRIESRSDQATRIHKIGALIADAKRQLPTSLRSDKLSWSNGKLSLHRGGQVIATAPTAGELITRALNSPAGSTPELRAARAKVKAIQALAAAQATLARYR